MATFTSIVTFLGFLAKYGPVIWKAIADGVDVLELKIELRKFDKAVEKAETGDQRDLENMFNPGKHPK